MDCTIPTLIPLAPERLRAARAECGLTIEEAALSSSINRMTLQRYESGDIRAVSPERLFRLAETYRRTPASLAGISREEEFFLADEGLLFTPDAAAPPSHLGRRLLVSLRFSSRSV